MRHQLDTIPEFELEMKADIASMDNTDTTMLFALAERLLLDRYLLRGSNYETVHLLVRDIPPEFALQVPIPQGARLLGSVSTSALHYVTIVLDAHIPPDECIEGFNTLLPNYGWQHSHFDDELITNAGPAAYVEDSWPQSAWRNENYQLLASATSLAEGVTDIRLDLARIQIAAEPHQNTDRNLMNGDNLVGVIDPPTEARQEVKYASVGDFEAEWNVVIQTGLALRSILNHYQNHIESRGFVLGEEDCAARHAYMNWQGKHASRVWKGFLTIAEIPSMSGSYIVNVYAQRTTPLSHRHTSHHTFGTIE